MANGIFIGLGANLGDREAQLAQALARLRTLAEVDVTGCSSLYDTLAVGPAQPRYLNAAIMLTFDSSPRRLLDLLKGLEREQGRTQVERWGPRVIDLDILLWDGLVMNEVGLNIPHPQLHLRRFVLEPLCELAPDLIHPVLGLSMRSLLTKLEPQPRDVVRIGSSGTLASRQPR